jgi:DNA-binding NarL/FixJ family response regulator
MSRSSSKSGSVGDKKKILIVDDHPMMREGLAQLINSQSDLAVCGDAGDAQEGIARALALRPDVVLLDITLPGRNGVELIKDIRAQLPDARILVISMHDESLYAERVLRAGGRGYVMKQEGGKKIMEALRQVLSGNVAVSEKMSAKILDAFSGRRADAALSPVETLTDREFEVLQLLGKGMSTAEMAAHLHVSPKTIEVHRANIKAKLKLQTAAELLRYAVRWVESQ